MQKGARKKINMASMGETCAEMGYHFYWPAWSEQPHFWRDGGSNEVPLTMVNRVPFLLRPYSWMAAPGGPGRG